MNKSINYTIIKETKSKNIAHRIRVGNIYQTIELNSEERLCLVADHQLIVMQRWQGGLYGTNKWLLYIFRTGTLRDFKNKVPDVDSKVDLLFFCRGSHQVKQALQIIDSIKKLEIDFNSLDSYWLHQHARIKTCKPLIMPYV